MPGYKAITQYQRGLAFRFGGGQNAAHDGQARPGRRLDRATARGLAFQGPARPALRELLPPDFTRLAGG